MDIKLFDKRYVYLEWSDELEGKDCILAKTYQDLKDFVNSGDEGRFCKANKGKEKPFTNLWSECDFCYYDPSLKIKKAWLEGKTIQQKCGLNEWKNYIELPRTSSYFYNINWDAYEWRIKPIEEIWWVIFAEDTFLRVSMITNLSNLAFFSGEYEECGKWIDEHKVYAEILSAWKHGKTIQYKPKGCDFWTDYTLKEYPNTDSFERCDWRIKPEYIFDDIVDYSDYQPTEPRYYLSVNKNGYLEFTISQNITNDTIYIGTRKECERMMKIIGNEFEEEDISHCDISYRLRYIIAKYSHEKYKRRMTNRELAEYLAKGNGEVKNLRCTISTSTCYVYKNNTENENVDNHILIRDFGSNEWRQPLIEV